MKSQVGATITHRCWAAEDRGVQLDRTMQLNVGGNMDFSTCSNERLESKSPKTPGRHWNSKARVQDQTCTSARPDTSDGSRAKWAYVLEGRASEMRC